MTPAGRRPGSPRTREDILEAARAEFTAHGYRGATIRGIAAAAAVDPSLVHHYFGTKHDLFLTALELPYDPGLLLRNLLQHGVDDLAERLVRTVVTTWDAVADNSPFTAIVRSVAAGDEASTTVREFVETRIIGEVAATIPADEPWLRAQLVASQLLGLVLFRYVLELEPLASQDVETLVKAYAPTVQRYLTGELGADVGSGPSTSTPAQAR